MAYLIKPLDRHVSGINQVLELMKFVPDFSAVDRNWSDHKVFNRVKIRFISVCEIWVVSQKVLELVRLGLKLAIFILEHANGASSMNDKNLWLILAHNDILILFAGVNLFMEMNLADNLLMDLGLVH